MICQMDLQHFSFPINMLCINMEFSTIMGKKSLICLYSELPPSKFPLELKVLTRLRTKKIVRVRFWYVDWNWVVPYSFTCPIDFKDPYGCWIGLSPGVVLFIPMGLLKQWVATHCQNLIPSAIWGWNPGSFENNHTTLVEFSGPRILP